MEILISNAAGRPIYEQITEQIKSLILSGKLKKGNALPSMRFLAKELRVSVITTKRAYEDLERDGFIETMAGKGCYVADHDPEVLKEEYRRRAERALKRAVAEAKSGGITREELVELVRMLYEGDEKI